LYSLNNGNFGLYNNTASSYAYIVDASGNLGLGVTPSAWYNTGGYVALQVANSSLFGRNSSSELYLSANTYYDLSGNATYIASNYATQYRQNNGVHSWQIAASGTAGNAITFTQAMTLDASGRLGIGTTSPTQKLHVEGTGTTYALIKGGGNNTVGLLTQNGNKQYFTGTYYNVSDAWEVADITAGGLTRLVITSAGNVGVGTSSPASVLEVAGTSAITDFRISRTVSASTYFYITAPGGTPSTATLGVNGTGVMSLNASGNVGIGTTSPARNLTVSTSTDTYISALGSTTGEVGVLFGDSGNDAIGRILYVNAGDFMQFYTNNSEQMRLSSTGELLINTTSNSATSNVGSKFVSNGRLFTVSSYSDNTQESLSMYSTTASAYRFYVGWGGTVYATNTTISAISDIRYKENVRDLDSALNKLMLLKPRVFDWKEGMGKNIKNDKGFIAQEFEQIFPELVDKWKEKAPQGEEPYKSIRQDLIPYLVKAIQELKAEIETLKNK
jgi:hypothetical protein